MLTAFTSASDNSSPPAHGNSFSPPLLPLLFTSPNDNCLPLSQWQHLTSLLAATAYLCQWLQRSIPAPSWGTAGPQESVWSEKQHSNCSTSYDLIWPACLSIAYMTEHSKQIIYPSFLSYHFISFLPYHFTSFLSSHSFLLFVVSFHPFLTLSISSVHTALNELWRYNNPLQTTPETCWPYVHTAEQSSSVCSRPEVTLCG